MQRAVDVAFLSVVLCLTIALGPSCIKIEPPDVPMEGSESMVLPPGATGSGSVSAGSSASPGTSASAGSVASTGSAGSNPASGAGGAPSAAIPGAPAPMLPPPAGAPAPMPPPRMQPAMPGPNPTSAPAWAQTSWSSILTDGFSSNPSPELQALASRVTTRVSQNDLDAVAAIDWTTITGDQLAAHPAFMNVLVAVEAEFPSVMFEHVKLAPSRKPNANAFARIAHELLLPGRAQAQEVGWTGTQFGVAAVGTVVLTAAAGLAAGAAFGPFVGVFVAASMLTYLLYPHSDADWNR